MIINNIKPFYTNRCVNFSGIEGFWHENCKLNLMPKISKNKANQESSSNGSQTGTFILNNKSQQGLTLFRFDSMDDWRSELLDALQKIGYTTYQKRNAVWAWEDGKTVPCQNDQPSVAYGCEFTREPLGTDEPCLAIRAKEIYFQKGEVVHLVPEQKKQVSGPAQELRIEYCLKIAERLATIIPGLEAMPVRIRSAHSGVHQRTSLVFKNHKTDPAIDRPWTGLRKFGFHTMPKNFKVVVFVMLPTDERVQSYIAFLRNAFRSYGEIVDIEIRPFFSDYHDLREGAVGLFGLEGSKEVSLREEELEFLDRLDRKNVRYRMFSLANSDMKWSAFDQAVSLVHTAGGIPYHLELPWPEAKSCIFSIGVDLGHPIKEAKSILAISLIDPKGLHIKSWRYEQARSENADLSALQCALAKAKALAEKISPEEECRFLVVRDGRRNKSERVGHYREVLGQAMTFVDLSKRRSCHMFALRTRPKPAEPGTVLFVGKKNTPFIVPIAPAFHQQMINPQKVNLRKEWDGLGLGFGRVCALLTGMCYSPSLGMKPHRSPAPIYWANGIAGIQESNCQFRGQLASQLVL